MTNEVPSVILVADNSNWTTLQYLVFISNDFVANNLAFTSKNISF